MSRIVSVDKPSSLRNTAGPRPRRPLTVVWPAGKAPTFVAPVSDPGGRTRPQSWDVFSRDGLWHYQRYETGSRTSWAVIYRPTRQRRDGYGGLDDARAATASGGVLDAMRSEAFVLALKTPLSEPGRANGHRWLAIHLRTSGTVKGNEADHRCRCGGYLATITQDGDVAHLDACEHCYTYGQGLPTEVCPHAGSHRFCADPLAAGLENGCGLWRSGCCPTDCRTPVVTSR